MEIWEQTSSEHISDSTKGQEEREKSKGGEYKDREMGDVSTDGAKYQPQIGW